jgi:hypothetical protein
MPEVAADVRRLKSAAWRWKNAIASLPRLLHSREALPRYIPKFKRGLDYHIQLMLFLLR